jgi:hypothetical protein
MDTGSHSETRGILRLWVRGEFEQGQNARGSGHIYGAKHSETRVIYVPSIAFGSSRAASQS